jgi:hypothetical protein
MSLIVVIVPMAKRIRGKEVKRKNKYFKNQSAMKSFSLLASCPFYNS